MAIAPPLEGIRILDFSRVMAGPFCTALLADVGADVIKVEPPQGDDYRHIGPFVGGEGGLFLLMNRNKRSIALDLKAPEGFKIAHELIAKCDVVVHATEVVIVFSVVIILCLIHARQIALRAR